MNLIWNSFFFNQIGPAPIVPKTWSLNDWNKFNLSLWSFLNSPKCRGNAKSSLWILEMMIMMINFGKMPSTVGGWTTVMEAKNEGILANLISKLKLTNNGSYRKGCSQKVSHLQSRKKSEKKYFFCKFLLTMFNIILILKPRMPFGNKIITKGY